MELRSDWFDILLRGLPEDEQNHALRVMAQNDETKLDQIRTASDREAERIRRRAADRAARLNELASQPHIST